MRKEIAMLTNFSIAFSSLCMLVLLDDGLKPTEHDTICRSIYLSLFNNSHLMPFDSQSFYSCGSDRQAANTRIMTHLCQLYVCALQKSSFKCQTKQQQRQQHQHPHAKRIKPHETIKQNGVKNLSLAHASISLYCSSVYLQCRRFPSMVGLCCEKQTNEWQIFPKSQLRLFTKRRRIM